LDVDDLLRMAPLQQLRERNEVRSSGDAALDKQVYDVTCTQRDAGLLQGPLSDSELEDACGKLWIPSRRFGISQKGKLREIDDFSIYGQNKTVWAEEKLDCRGIDDVVSMIKCWSSLNNRTTDVGLGVPAAAARNLQGT
jgi:hypothetical protein